MTELVPAKTVKPWVIGCIGASVAWGVVLMLAVATFLVSPPNDDESAFSRGQRFGEGAARFVVFSGLASFGVAIIRRNRRR